MKPLWRLSSSHFLSHVGSAVVAQGLLSAANFAIGLLLLRSAGPQPYAHYVLAMNSVALVVSLQTAFLGPPLSTRLPGLSTPRRAALVGALLAEQRHALRHGAMLAFAGGLVFTVCLWFLPHGHSVDPGFPFLSVPLVLGCSLLTAIAGLRREFVRQTLLALRRAHEILLADLTYALIAVGGVWLARQVPDWTAPATVLLAVALGAIVSRARLLHSLHQQFIPPQGRQSGLLQEMAPLALWSVSGAALFWLYTQGFLYLVAAKLGTTAVAALAATRLLLMPMNLLSSGLGGLLAPAAAGWLGELGRAGLLRRLTGIAFGMGTITACWGAVLYFWHEPLFKLLFKHPVGHAGTLLLAWSAVYISMGLRDQLGYLLTALGRYRQLTLLTALATLTSLGSCLAGMSWWPDTRGAMLGIVTGETISLLGIVVLVVRAVRQQPDISPGGIASPA